MSLALTINGKSVKTPTTYGVVNPASGRIEAQAPLSEAEHLDAAFESAEEAFKSWRTDEDARRAAMLNLADSITAHAEELTSLLQLETGKPLAAAAAEPAVCAGWLQYFASLEIPETIIESSDSSRIVVRHRPLGVVAAITPWNFPLGLAMWKIAPALRAGNTIVVKPSPFTPLSTLLLGQIMGESLPPGVVNTISGNDHLGAAMVAHRVPRKVTLTGSINAGKKVGAAAGGSLKRVTLELGGNDAAILLSDVDVPSVAAALVPIAFMNSGQACALPKRIYAPDAIYEEVVTAFAEVASGMVVGDPTAPETVLGPLSTEPQFKRVAELVSDARAHGARVVTGGNTMSTDGFFFEATILADVDSSVRIVREEQFGLALPIVRYGSLDEAIAEANGTEFGLCGSVWSNDEEEAIRVADLLEVGSAFVNTHADLRPNVPFGGVKSSGIGVENGEAGLLEFTQTQVLNVSRR